MEDRRNFVLKIASEMAAKGLKAVSEQAKANRMKVNTVFIHHVFFWLKEPGNPEIRAQFEQGLNELIKVPQIQYSHIGTPAESSREVVDGSFTYSYMALFRDKEDQEIYQVHPIHQQFIENCQHLWEKVIVYDALN